ncbi:MAG: class I adenylate-forming enzyme family protein [Chloroflexota bacterium]
MLSTSMTMMEAVCQVANSRPEQEALVCGEVRVTYGQLLEQIHALAQGLCELGIQKGDRVVAYIPPGFEFVCLFFALAKLGGVILPLDIQTRPRRLGAVLRDAEPVALVTYCSIEEEVLDQAKSLQYVIFTERGEEGNLVLSDLMKNEQIATLGTEVFPNDLLALLYTSGTTGEPKGTMHTHRSLIAPVVATLKIRELWLHRPSVKMMGKMVVALARYRERLLRAAGRPQTILTTTGWQTTTGLEGMLQGILMGDKLVVMPRFHPREALRLIEQERVTVLIAVPMAYQVMLGLEGFEEYDTSSLLICGTGAAPCPAHLAREIQRRFDCAVHIGFGATETGGGIAVTSISDSDKRQAETVGRPLPDMEIKIVDDLGCQLPAGQTGELLYRGESLMLGYYRDPELTAEVMDEEGWYHTGDLAKLDEQGYLHIVGRKKDMIIRAGQNIYPAEIEDYLAAHPKISEAVVVGVPAKIGGEEVWAFLHLKENSQMSAQEVLDYCREELERYKIPSQVRFVDGFPRTEMGKPQKFVLRQQALQEREGD